MSIPVVLIHVGFKPYVEHVVEFNTKTNNLIIIIGDESLKFLENRYQNCKFYNIKNLEKDYMIDYYQSFTNYSSNSKDIEWICFKRVFILKEFMKHSKYDRVFHIDSDNVLLYDINTYPFTKDVAYVCNKNWDNNMRMSNSIHSALLNIEFCETFESLFNDIYKNQSRLFLIEDKIRFHKKGDKFFNGGVCDMTLYYLIQNMNLLDVQDLLNIVQIDDKEYSFMNTLLSPEGSHCKKQYETQNDVIQIDKNNCMKFGDKHIHVFNIHFQGWTKHLLKDHHVISRSH